LKYRLLAWAADKGHGEVAKILLRLEEVNKGRAKNNCQTPVPFTLRMNMRE